jgi:hypothetical protein
MSFAESIGIAVFCLRYKLEATRSCTIAYTTVMTISITSTRAMLNTAIALT